MLSALIQRPLCHLAVDVVIGINHPDIQSIATFVAARPATMLYQGLPSLAGLMARADLMVGGGGTTSWERMCLGLPAIVMSIADNQTHTNKALMNAGFINYVGEMDTTTSGDIFIAIQNCLTNYDAMRNQSALMQSLVTGTGAMYVTDFLLERVQIDATTPASLRQIFH